MNCDECKNLISVFLDSELDAAVADNVRTHLALCADCARVCEDFASILDVVSDVPAGVLPPNSQALWCRINNIIENEMKPAPPPPEPQRGRFWHFSLGQLTAAVMCIAVVSSLLTFVAIKNYAGVEPEVASGRTAERTLFERAMSRLGLAESALEIRERRIKEQQAAIEYWNARVQTRRTKWDPVTRAAFDRNMYVIDQSVSEYSMIVQRDPEDDLSVEMLDSVLADKMHLLRDFSDL